MANTSEAAPEPISERSQPDAATEALVRFTESAKDLFQYHHIYVEGAEAKKSLSLKETEIKEKDDKIKELESAIAVWTHGGNKEVSRMKVENAELKNEISNLKTRLQQESEEHGKVRARAEDAKHRLNVQGNELWRLQGEADA